MCNKRPICTDCEHHRHRRYQNILQHLCVKHTHNEGISMITGKKITPPKTPSCRLMRSDRDNPKAIGNHLPRCGEFGDHYKKESKCRDV